LRRRPSPARSPHPRPRPTANWAPKVWPAERFVALYQRLAPGPLANAVPVVLSGPGETEAAMARPVLDALPGALDLAGRLSLAEIAALLSRADLFVATTRG